MFVMLCTGRRGIPSGAGVPVAVSITVARVSRIGDIYERVLIRGNVAGTWESQLARPTVCIPSTERR